MRCHGCGCVVGIISFCSLQFYALNFAIHFGCHSFGVLAFFVCLYIVVLIKVLGYNPWC